MNYQTRLTLMERLKNSGDEKSWDEFNNVYRGFIYSIVKSMYVEETQIDDIIQEVLLSVWKALPGFQYDSSKGRFSSWLATITSNTVKSSKLKKSRQAARDHKAYEQKEGEISTEFDTLVEREWITFLTKKAWDNVSANLSDVMKTCFEKIMDGMKVKEVAADMGIPDNTVSVYKKRISTVMKREIHRLREELD